MRLVVVRAAWTTKQMLKWLNDQEKRLNSLSQNLQIAISRISWRNLKKSRESRWKPTQRKRLITSNLVNSRIFQGLQALLVEANEYRHNRVKCYRIIEKIMEWYNNVMQFNQKMTKITLSLRWRRVTRKVVFLAIQSYLVIKSMSHKYRWLFHLVTSPYGFSQEISVLNRS